MYRAEQSMEADKQVLRLDDQPRWFVGFPREVSQEVYEAWVKQQGQISRQESAEGERVYQNPSTPKYPRSVAELPPKNQGASLKLTVAADDKSDDDKSGDEAASLSLTLTLSAGDRAIQREIEHRRTNVLPFLFAFTADGKPVSKDAVGGVGEGGKNQFIELVPAQSQKSWTVQMTLESLASIVPADASEIEIVAVFSERQHEAYAEGGPISIGEVWSSEAIKNRPPQIVVRSNVVHLRKEGTRRGFRQKSPH